MTVSIPIDALHPRHRERARRLADEAATLARWADFRTRYDAACNGADGRPPVPHGQRTALRLAIGAEMGMDDRETQRAIWGG